MSRIKYILSRNGKEKGTVTAYGHKCKMEGCTGKRFTVKWEDGTWNFICSKGIKIISEDTAQII